MLANMIMKIEVFKLTRHFIISLKAGLEAYGTEAKPAEMETAEVDLITFSNCAIES